ncbi:MAG: hypothetical protein JSR70_04215, partial [Proteobacteria bacterium]|nr:hypothetical protein [Pseudomonadota bacterium]
MGDDREGIAYGILIGSVLLVGIDRMKAEFIDSLFQNYPVIFSKLRDFPDQFSVFRAFDCENGWYTL